jgi:hypothetical protein
LFDPALKSTYYKPQTTHLHYKLDATAFYTVIASTFKSEQMASGCVMFETD